MGVTIRSKNLSADMGYGGFKRFRTKVAHLCSEEFGKHFDELDKALLIWEEKERNAYYDEYNEKTHKMIEEKIVAIEAVDFCHQSDCEGSITRKQAKLIYEKIKDYEDNIAYGYAGWSDCTTFADLKSIFKDCIDNPRSKIKWR